MAAIAVALRRGFGLANGARGWRGAADLLRGRARRRLPRLYLWHSAPDQRLRSPPGRGRGGGTATGCGSPPGDRGVEAQHQSHRHLRLAIEGDYRRRPGRSKKHDGRAGRCRFHRCRLAVRQPARQPGAARSSHHRRCRVWLSVCLSLCRTGRVAIDRRRFTNSSCDPGGSADNAQSAAHPQPLRPASSVVKPASRGADGRGRWWRSPRGGRR